jgi:hypothetical protein
MYKLTNSLENKMKKQYFTNLLFGFLLLAGTALSSCSNEELSNEEIESGTRTITFDISQGFEESADEKMRGFSEKNDTIYQKFSNGMEISTFIEEDKAINSRATEVVEVGTKVLAIVVDENNKICKIQTTEIETYYKLTCQVPNYKVRIIFYSHNSKSSIPTIPLSVGDYISTDTKTNTIGYEKYAMIAETGFINPGNSSMGTILFKHAFCRARVCLYYGKGVTSFTTTLKDMSNESAKVNINTYQIERSNTGYKDLEFTGSRYSSSTNLFSAFYLPFIPRNDATNIDVYLDKINDKIIGESTTLYYNFKPGHSYTIYINVGNRSKIVDGWTPKFYQWDAKAIFTPGTTPAAGSSSHYNESSDIASNSCKDCPTNDEIRRIMNSGVYWDDNGEIWSDYEGRIHRTGVWVKKRNKWAAAGSSGGEIPEATDAIRNSDDYVFLPASGWINGSSVADVGERGFYWSSDAGVCMSFSKAGIWSDKFSRNPGMTTWYFPQ